MTTQSPESPTANMLRLLSIYDRIRNSKNPVDVMQCIDIAKEVALNAEQLIAETQESRIRIGQELGFIEIPAETALAA
jgi:hypothetical protein